jgi:hypothetical protein
MIDNPFVYSVGSGRSAKYYISGDKANVVSLTKKECEQRIRTLCNSGEYDAKTRNALLAQLKQFKVR